MDPFFEKTDDGEEEKFPETGQIGTALISKLEKKFYFPYNKSK